MFGIFGMLRDINWNQELNRIQTQFFDEEVTLLYREKFFFVEAAFVLLEILGIIAMGVHTYLCFRKSRTYFYRSKRVRENCSEALRPCSKYCIPPLKRLVTILKF